MDAAGGKVVIYYKKKTKAVLYNELNNTLKLKMHFIYQEVEWKPKLLDSVCSIKAPHECGGFHKTMDTEQSM